MAIETTVVQQKEGNKDAGYASVAITVGQTLKFDGIHTDGRVKYTPVTADTDIAAGVALFTVEATKQIDVASFGFAVALSHGNIPQGAYVIPSTTGRVKTATGAAAGKNIIGRAYSTTTGDGKNVLILIGEKPSLTV